MNNQLEWNDNGDIVQATSSQPKSYVIKAAPKTIKFSSRASVKIVRGGQDHYYTVEYGEERQIDNYQEVNMDIERQALIDTCNNQVDKQVEEIIKTFYNF